MSYNAEAVGNIVFAKKLSGNEYLAIDRRLTAVGIGIDILGIHKFLITYDSGYGYGFDDDILSALNSVSEIAEVLSGNLEFIGEDDTHWRFIYKDGKWRKERGEIVYYPCDS